MLTMQLTSLVSFSHRCDGNLPGEDSQDWLFTLFPPFEMVNPMGGTRMWFQPCLLCQYQSKLKMQSLGFELVHNHKWVDFGFDAGRHESKYKCVLSFPFPEWNFTFTSLF